MGGDNKINLQKMMDNPKTKAITLNTLNSLSPEAINNFSNEAAKFFYILKQQQLIDANNSPQF